MFAYVALGGSSLTFPPSTANRAPFWYPLAYAARVVIVAVLAWHYRATWVDFRPWPETGNAASWRC